MTRTTPEGHTITNEHPERRKLLKATLIRIAREHGLLDSPSPTSQGQTETPILSSGRTPKRPTHSSASLPSSGDALLDADRETDSRSLFSPIKRPASALEQASKPTASSSKRDE